MPGPEVAVNERAPFQLPGGGKLRERRGRCHWAYQNEYHVAIFPQNGSDRFGDAGQVAIVRC